MRSWAFALLGLAILTRPAPGQDRLAANQAPVRLTLEDALRRALPESEALQLAHVAVDRARGDERQARAEFYPQLTGSASFTKLLESQFGSFANRLGSDSTSNQECERFVPDPSRPIAERIDSLEAAVRCASVSNPFASFASLPFGRENTYTFGLGVSQTLFAGGRVRGQAGAAAAARESASIGVTSAEAAVILDVVEAYYDAVLSERLFAVAEATLAQADTTFRQTGLRREAGTAPEFDLLRARVARDNQRPVVIQRRSERDLAYLRLQQLLNLPADQLIVLATDLEDLDPSAVPALAPVLAAAPDTAPEHRAPVRQAEEGIRGQEHLLQAAKALAFPSVVLSSQYAKVAYPLDGLPTFEGYLTNWSVGVSLSVPIFTGGRLSGQRQVARANLEEARLRHRQIVEQARLDSRNAVNQYDAARAAWQASEGTAEQAVQAHAIAQLRYQEGLGTQTELLDARIALQQAEWNRAQAARDLQVTRIRLGLLRDLPLTGAVPQTSTRSLSPSRLPPTTAVTQTSLTGSGIP